MKLKVLIFLLLLSSAIIYAGDEKSNVRGLGMAGATTVTSRTIDAIGINPALLGYIGVAQGAEFKGKVIDADTKQPIPGARVTIKGRGVDLTTRTNFSGNFSFSNIPPGKYTVVITQKGYQTISIINFQTKPGSSINGVIRTKLLGLGKDSQSPQEEKVIAFEEVGFEVKEMKTLIYNDGSGFTMSLIPQFGVGIGANFLGYQIYLDYFTGVDSAGKKVGKYLNDEDKQKILDSFNEDFGTFLAQIDVKALSFAFRVSNVGIGLALREKAFSRFDMQRDFVRFLLYGNSPGSIYSFDVGIGGAWVREYSVSVGTKLPFELTAVKNINAGIGVKFIQGFGFVGSEKLGLTIETADSSRGYEMTANIKGIVKRAGVDFLDPDKEANFTPFPTPAGTGLGFDLGVSAEILGLFTAGISITDIGSINWTKNAVIISGDTTFKFSGYTTQERIDSLKESFEDYIKSSERKRYESFSTGLPTAIRIGVATDLKTLIPVFPGRMLISADYFQPIGDEQMMFKKSKLALGLEWRPVSLLPLRTGISIGGFEGFALSVGTGLNLPFLEFNIATGNLNEIMSGGNLRNFSFATELRLKF
jgi:hypothetical protein